MFNAQTLELSATLIPCEEGGFTAICNEVRGAVTQGETAEEALNNLKDAALQILVVMAMDPKNKSAVAVVEEGSYQKNFEIEFC